MLHLSLTTTVAFLLGFFSLLSQHVAYAAQLSLQWPTHPEIGQTSTIQWSGGLPPVRLLRTSLLLDDNS